MRALNLLVYFFLVAVAGAQTLTIEPSLVHGKLAVDATLAGQTRRVDTLVKWKDWRRDVRALHDRLAKYEPATLDPELERLGQVLFGELSRELERAAEVVFVVPKDELRQPLDLLHWKGAPLYLAKPVAYVIAGLDKAEEVRAATPPSAWTSALLATDPTADPDNAVKACRAYWTDVKYMKAGKLTAKKLEHTQADVLLVSAHGSVTKGETDSIGVGGDDIEGETFASVAPQLVYFDSCDIGVSRSFLEAFRAAGTRYYLAPVISNEAGDSSTATMRAFFAALHAGRSPTVALFETRRTLHDQYRSAGSELLWKCFPFRLYLLQER